MALFMVLLSLLFLQITAAENEHTENTQKSFRSTKNDVIAFSAEGYDYDYVVAPGDTLVLNHTITNAGGLYSNKTGQFACADGMFVFIWNLAIYCDSDQQGMRGIGSLRSDGIDRKYGPKTSYAKPGISGVTEMIAIIQCSSPPTPVTVIAQPWTESGNNTAFIGFLNTFSGFKLQASIAFAAELSQDQYAFPGARSKFDKVLSNFGGYYDVLNNRFHCPDAGVYVFSISTQTRDPNTPWSVSRLLFQGKVAMQGPITFIATTDYDSGSASTTTILQCTPDASVYVEAHASYNFPYNSYGAKLTSFTGFKLYDVSATAVAFSVLMSQNFTTTSSGPVPFDEVITNIGGAFDTSSSRFVCPDDEYYLFTWTAVMPIYADYLFLMMNGSYVKDLLPNPFKTGTTGSCTQSIILQCQTLSVVQLGVYGRGVQFVGGYTSFSGYKIPG